jgi:hypothetical protein
MVSTLVRPTDGRHWQFNVVGGMSKQSLHVCTNPPSTSHYIPHQYRIWNLELETYRKIAVAIGYLIR